MNTLAFYKGRTWLTAIALVTFTALAPCRKLQVGEYKVKAAFLLNFAKYVDWPQASNSGPLVIGVVGKDPFEGVLEGLAKDKLVNGRKLVVRHVAWDEAASVHMLFVPQTEPAAGIQKVAKLPVVTVGESPSFNGGVINFRIVNDRVTFEINASAAKANGLSISSQLLKLAAVVK